MKPENDGITHINIYSQGQTELGRMLSNFYRCDVQTEHGKFKSVEGYWYWLGCRNDYLKRLYGYKAKKFGQNQKKTVSLPKNKFQNFIKRAITNKITQNEHIKQPFTKSILPFTHYYVYGGKVVDAGYKWIVEHISDLRDELVLR